MGKLEYSKEVKNRLFAHVSAVTVSSANRRMGIASYLMKYFEDLAKL